MVDLSGDEEAVLEIASHGESMAAIGRWKRPIESLVKKGLLARFDEFNHSITQAGREAIEEGGEADEKKWESLAKAFVSVNNAQVEIRTNIKTAVDKLVEAVKLTNKLKGDAPRYALEQWLSVIANEAAERLK